MGAILKPLHSKTTLSLILLFVVMIFLGVSIWSEGRNRDRLDRQIRKLEQDMKQLQQAIDQAEKEAKAKEKKE